MDEKKLLKSIYRAIDWRKLYEIEPRAERETVDRFFGRLREMLGTQPEDSTAPQSGAGTADDHDELVIRTDGGSRGNPGPAAIGVVLEDSSGEEVMAWGDYIGRTTSNVAEYSALIAALEKALELGAERVRVFADSQLLTRQINGRYRVKSDRLKPLYNQVTSLLDRFDKWNVKHVRRNKNKRADGLANEALDEHKKRSRGG